MVFENVQVCEAFPAGQALIFAYRGVYPHMAAQAPKGQEGFLAVLAFNVGLELTITLLFVYVDSPEAITNQTPRQEPIKATTDPCKRSNLYLTNMQVRIEIRLYCPFIDIFSNIKCTFKMLSNKFPFNTTKQRLFDKCVKTQRLIKQIKFTSDLIVYIG